MTPKQKSKRAGVLKKGTTGNRQASRSTNAGNPSISDMSGSTPPTSPSFRATKNLRDDPNATNAQLVMAFARGLGELVEWRFVRLADGREGYALFFPLGKWRVDETGALVPNE